MDKKIDKKVLILIIGIFCIIFIKSIYCSDQDHDMVLILMGEFIMGSSEDNVHSERDEKPQHRVYLDSFYIDIYEVSVGHFREFVEETGYEALGDWDDPFFDQSDEHPVVNVSWYDVIKYCNWRSTKEGLEPCYNVDTGECDFTKDGYRLPTEAEWEKAARGADMRIFPWGNESPDSEGHYRANYSKKPEGDFYYTLPVDSYEKGKSFYGLYNMAGNIWEWCNDRYSEDYYENSPYENPRGPEIGKSRVLRGGFWFSYEKQLRAADRTRDKPSYLNGYYGFRCARSKL